MRLLPKPVGQVVSGTVFMQGRDLLALKESEMRLIRGELISMIFQDPMTSLNPIMSIGDQIMETLSLHNSELRSKREIDARVNEMLEMVGISAERRKEYPHQLSGGMKQRVVIAIALACEPELLIADEPTTALDVTIQAQVLSLMKDLKKKLGTSMILITHDLGVVARACDKVAIMYAGDIIESGTVVDIFGADEHHPYTRGLFGSIPNLEIRTDRLTPIDGKMPDPTGLPLGCSFSPRCPSCMPICRETRPEPIICGSHMRRCFLYGGAYIAQKEDAQ
jgi:peptide/nickel transport system ATP-binding protein